MDSMLKSLVDLLLSQGLSGVFIVVLLAEVNYLYRSNEKLQDQRVNELRAMLEIVARNTEAVNKFIEVIKGCPK